jgi:hypothetical protein
VNGPGFATFGLLDQSLSDLFRQPSRIPLQEKSTLPFPHVLYPKPVD